MSSLIIYMANFDRILQKLFRDSAKIYTKFIRKLIVSIAKANSMMKIKSGIYIFILGNKKTPTPVLYQPMPVLI